MHCKVLWNTEQTEFGQNINIWQYCKSYCKNQKTFISCYATQSGVEKDSAK